MYMGGNKEVAVDAGEVDGYAGKETGGYKIKHILENVLREE